MPSIVVVLLAASLASLSSSPALQGPGADLRVDHGTWVDPAPAGYYSYYIYNDSAEAADNVRLRCETPAGSTFRRIAVEPGGASQAPRCETPASDQAGEIVVRLGTLAPGAFVSVVVDLGYTGAIGSDVSMRLTAASDTPDPTPENNAYLYENSISAPPVAPTITDVRARRDRELGLTVTIQGQNLVGPFSYVGLGCNCTPWTHVAVVSETELVLFGGEALRAAFPKGVPVPICVINPGAGIGHATFTRR
jgi:hypothetical protein